MVIMDRETGQEKTQNAQKAIKMIEQNQKTNKIIFLNNSACEVIHQTKLGEGIHRCAGFSIAYCVLLFLA